MREILKKAREDRKLSVEEIAKIFNISPSFYYKIESGTRNPNIKLANEISSYFNLGIEELFFNNALDETSKTSVLNPYYHPTL